MNSLPLPASSRVARLALALLAAAAPARAAAPGGSLLRSGDVVALVGGEDFVAAAEHGYLEYLVLRQRPALEVRFRGLGKEGDTAFQQARDFNYPVLERQLNECGATVVLLQVGLMESARGPGGIAEFEQKAAALSGRLADGRRRRVILVGPAPLPPASPSSGAFAAVGAYREAVARVAQRQEIPAILPGERRSYGPEHFRNGLHLGERGHFEFAAELADALLGVAVRRPPASPDERRLLAAVQSKNQRWFHYVRPENWAFLDGDRTVQPASRDHRNPERRWFPEEMKEWLPLVLEQEREAWTLARNLRTP